MGLKSNWTRTARLPIKAEPPKDGDAKPERLKSTQVMIRTDRLTERQNQGNLATQSHGSKVKFFDQDSQTAEEL